MGTTSSPERVVDPKSRWGKRRGKASARGLISSPFVPPAARCSQRRPLSPSGPTPLIFRMLADFPVLIRKRAPDSWCDGLLSTAQQLWDWQHYRATRYRTNESHRSSPGPDPAGEVVNRDDLEYQSDPVAASGDDALPVGRELRSIDAGGMVFQLSHHLTGGRVPHPRGVVIA